jgi:arylsulfatase A-like enzyme
MKNATLASSLFLAAVPAVTGYAKEPATNQTMRPNVLIIMTDQQRFDALGCVGTFPMLRTPNIDRLAATGAWFTNAYTPCAVSAPARSSILTGLMVEHHGVSANGLVSEDPATVHFTELKTFDQLLVESGYYAEYLGKYHSPIGWTSAYSEFSYAYPSKGSFRYRTHHFLDYYEMLGKVYPDPVATDDEYMDAYFDVPYKPDPIDHRAWLAAQKGVPLKATEEVKVAQGDYHGHLLIPDSLHMTAWQGRKTIEAIRRASKTGKPFSITCSFVFPHPPMVAPDGYYGMYQHSSLQAPATISDRHIDSPYRERAFSREEFRDPSLIPYMMSNYFGLVTEIDDWIGRILEELDRTGMRENTLIIFTSDHGEMLGSHGMYGKACFYEESAHIPLIINFPKQIEPTEVESYVTLLDLFPTIMGYTGVETEERDGQDLRPLVAGHKPAKNVVVTEWPVAKQPTLMIVMDGWKLYLNHLGAPVPAVLYDMNSDPSETVNLIGASHLYRNRYLPKASELKREMAAWLRQRGSVQAEAVEKLIID